MMPGQIIGCLYQHLYWGFYDPRCICWRLEIGQ